VVAFGSAPIAPTPVLDRLRIDLPLRRLPETRAPGRLLPYVTYFQRRPFWCWAAVAVSVARYYNPRSTVTQCQVASLTLGQQDCCSAGAETTRCDVRTSLNTALRVVRRYGGYGPADPDLARQLIDRGEPVGIFVRWTPTAGHFAALCGYSVSASGTEFVVADPKYGDRPVLASELLSGRYRGFGTWTHLYRTA
jgi:hypothetical protein